eukprot:1147355-Pelagomonas_calceolata.AAC.4
MDGRTHTTPHHGHQAQLISLLWICAPPHKKEVTTKQTAKNHASARTHAHTHTHTQALTCRAAHTLRMAWLSGGVPWSGQAWKWKWRSVRGGGGGPRST